MGDPSGQHLRGRASLELGRRDQYAAAATEKQLAPVPPAKTKASSNEPFFEVSTVVKEDPNEGITFSDNPAHCTCPHCERSVVTFIDYEASWVTWLLAFMVWFSLGWMAVWVLPILWPAFKDVVHHCPRCLNVIERRSRIHFPSFRQEVMSFKIGSCCAVVIARKYVVILLGLMALIGTAHLVRQNVQLNSSTTEENRGPPSLLTWGDFLEECGPKTSLRQRASIAQVFDKRFRRRTFKWQGEVQNVREGVEIFIIRTKSVVMIKMSPPRYPKRDIPDVALIFADDRMEEVADLKPGDWVEFEATMTAHGNPPYPEIMTMWHIARAERPLALAEASAEAKDAGNNTLLDQAEMPPPSQEHAPAGGAAARAKTKAGDKAAPAAAAAAAARAADKKAAPAAEEAAKADKVDKARPPEQTVARDKAAEAAAAPVVKAAAPAAKEAAPAAEAAAPKEEAAVAQEQEQTGAEQPPAA